MYLIDANEVDEVRTITEARIVSAYSKKPIIFKYPAHSINSYAIANLSILEWIHDKTLNYEIEGTPDYTNITTMCRKFADYMNREREVCEEYEWEAMTQYEFGGIRMIGVSLGIALYDSEYFTEEAKEDSDELGITEILEQHGVKVIDVEYGSQLHNEWNTFIRD